MYIESINNPYYNLKFQYCHQKLLPFKVPGFEPSYP